MNIAEYIADQLFKNGVRYVFGIPGGPSIPYIEAFRSVGIEFILTSNESAAGIMADVSARLTGISGVCHGTFGPGAVNLASGAGGALLDRSPVLIFTSEINDAMLARTTQMNIDQQQLFKPLTKATFRLASTNVAEVIDNALSICSQEYPGPVHIGLPADIFNSEIGAEPVVIHNIPGPTRMDNDNEKIISLLENARRPLLVAGLTAARYLKGNELSDFSEKFRIPVIITPMAKGLINEDNPYYAGVLFHALSDYLEDITEKADLVIGLGYDPVEYDYEAWLPEVPLVHFDTKITDIPQRNDIYRFTGTPAEWFSILENLDRNRPDSCLSDVKGLRDEMISVFDGFTDHFGPVTALKVLREELPDDAIVSFDVGSHLHLAGQFWKTSGKKNVLMTNGWSGMGFGLPAALSAQLAFPDKKVICVTGDGGFLMMAGEIITARRYNLPVITVVFADGELNLIKLKQQWKEIVPHSTSLYSGDMFDSDSFLGVSVLTADSEETMRTAINDSLQSKKPVIINARIDPDDYKWLVVRR